MTSLNALSQASRWVGRDTRRWGAWALEAKSFQFSVTKGTRICPLCPPCGVFKGCNRCNWSLASPSPSTATLHLPPIHSASDLSSMSQTILPPSGTSLQVEELTQDQIQAGNGIPYSVPSLATEPSGASSPSVSSPPIQVVTSPTNNTRIRRTN